MHLHKWNRGVTYQKEVMTLSQTRSRPREAGNKGMRWEGRCNKLEMNSVLFLHDRCALRAPLCVSMCVLFHGKPLWLTLERVHNAHLNVYCLITMRCDQPSPPAMLYAPVSSPP